METIELARRMAQLGETEEALRAYELVMNADGEPAELLEAAAYTLQNGGKYKIAYTVFVQLYNAGFFQSEILPLMVKAFYEPNVKLLKTRYERNCKLLSKYPYLFRKDFLPFEDLPVSFFPFDDHNGYVPFDSRTGAFRDFVNVREPVVSRNFFRDLEKPVLASDVYSQYELEYLNDNVRKSEWVGRENHIYLHYMDWGEFCSWLQVLTMKPLAESEKAVFLIGDELAQYPIDFKARFGIDYGQYAAQPIHIREINKLIWHTQLSSDNGGDFFNEIFDSHPNLLCKHSVMYDNVFQVAIDLIDSIKSADNAEEARDIFSQWEDDSLVMDLFSIKRDVTVKDTFVALYLRDTNRQIDPRARIVPALFFQPHFSNIIYNLESRGTGGTSRTVLLSEEADKIYDSPIFKGFKYVKTFTPLRRFTTAHAATMRWVIGKFKKGLPITSDGSPGVIQDVLSQRILNRSFMRDPENRLLKDSVIVRFEDGKLNPRATFTRLAAFLDIPYTESMTYCSKDGVHDVQTEAGNAVGFDPRTVYATYDEWASDAERRYCEFFLRDAYEFYGYGFQNYEGESVDLDVAKGWIKRFDVMKHWQRETGYAYFDEIVRNSLAAQFAEKEPSDGEKERIVREGVEKAIDDYLKSNDDSCENIAEFLLRELRFVNKRGQPLQMIPLLEPDPDLLDQPLYH